MNATSIAPPMSASACGSPGTNVLVAPVRGSTRNTLPARPSVTYNAPSGPIVLPEPQPDVQSGAANATSSRDTGGRGRCPAAALDATPVVDSPTAEATTSTVRNTFMVILPAVGRA